MISGDPNDRSWRPDSFVVPNHPLDVLLMGVRGTALRAEIAEAYGKLDQERIGQLLEQAERTREVVKEFGDPDLDTFGGQLLPLFLPGEVEVLRIESREDFEDVVSVRAHPHAGGWRLRVVDDDGTPYRSPRDWYPLRPTLGELIEFIRSVPCNGEDDLLGGLIRKEACGRPGIMKIMIALGLRGRYRVTSAFYPALPARCEAYLEWFIQSELVREAKLLRDEAVRLHALQHPDGPPLPDPGVQKDGWLQTATVREVAERLLAAGEDEMLAEFVEEFELAAFRQLDGAAQFGLAVGVTCERAGRFDLATIYYERARTHFVMDDATLYWLTNNDGYSLNQLGRHQEAEKLCRFATQSVPERHNAWKNLGLALTGLGHHAEAAKALARAAELCPKDPRAQAHLADLLAEHGDAIVAAVPELLPMLEALRGRGAVG